MSALTWMDFVGANPGMAAIGREMFYAFDVGLGFLATVRFDGGPRVHPVCPVFVGDRLYLMIIPGPKLEDLKRDSRFALHSETFPPPREDDGFYVSGRVIRITAGDVVAAVTEQFFAERPGMEKWPGFDDQFFYELLVDRALLTLTNERDGFPRGSTVWRAPATSEPVLRVAQPEDATAITKLIRQSAAALFPPFYGAETTQSAVESVARIDPNLLVDGTYFVLEAADEIVACGGWSRRDRLVVGSTAPPDCGRNPDPRPEPAHLRAMFVRADWTRRGLGRRILEESERAAAREGYRSLELMATLPGVLFYKASGFEATGPQQEVTLEDGVVLTCVPMAKQLGSAVVVTGSGQRAKAANT